MKATWTPADEAQFQALAKQRDEIRGRNESAVRIVAASIRRTVAEKNPTPSSAASDTELTSELARAMILHADSIRDALAPFDSGVREKLPEMTR